MAQATADPTATPEQTETEFDSDLLAGFAHDGMEPTPTTTPEPEPEPSATPDSPESSPAESPAREPETPVNELDTVQARIAALEANHKKYSDDVFGRVGMLEQVLKAQARTPAGQKVQVKLEDFGEFGAEYPDFANAQLKVINKVLGELELTGLSQDFTAGLIKDAGMAAETAAERRYARLRSEACREDLDETHPGWRDTIGLPEKDLDQGGVAPDTEYRRWLATQPKEYAERVLNAYSPVVIGKSIDKFTAWKQAQTKPKPQGSSPSLSRREQQLRSAVPARTTGTQPRQGKTMTEEEAMQAAFDGKL